MSGTVAEKRAAAVVQLWKAGNLKWKLDSAQRIIYDDIYAARKAGRSRFVLVCARRWGKTYALAVLALEQCLAHPNTHVAFVSKTKRSAKELAERLIKNLLVDCPMNLRPKYNKLDYRWTFTNRSTLSFLGCDSGHYEKARGREFNLILIDEAAFIDVLDDVVVDVMAPTLLMTNGFMILSSTPPTVPTHPFVQMFRNAQALKSYAIKTIYDNPRITPDQIERAKMDCGGENSVKFQREYLCKFVNDSSRSVIPEWTPERAAVLVREEPRARYCDKYIAMDFGTRDLTVILFAWWDFANARVVVEAEKSPNFADPGKIVTTAVVADCVNTGIRELWGNPAELKEFGEIYQISDVDPRLLYELRTLHGLEIQHTAKDNKLAQINMLRLMVQNGEIVIHPSCELLIATLYKASWDSKRAAFDHTEGIGHADALDALLYLIRNIRRDRNPAPPGTNWMERDGFVRKSFTPPKSSGASSFFSAVGQKSPQKNGPISAFLRRRRF